MMEKGSKRLRKTASRFFAPAWTDDSDRRAALAVEPPDLEHQDRQAREALGLVLAGDTDRGMALYDECVRGDSVSSLPIGVHLLFLQRAGRHSEAAALRDLTIERGGNVVLRGNAMASDPVESASEYESLFACGVGNSRMVFDYLLTLSRLGRRETVAAILDVDRLLRVIRLDLPPAEQALLARETDADLLEADQSIRRMRKLEGLDQWRDPAVQAVLAALREHTERCRADWASSDHPLAHLIPERLRMKCWGLISRGEGFNVRHIHARGWLTGVYYPTGVPGDGPGGELRIGGPAEFDGQASGWPDITIRPERGMLVIMPSYYMHWTMPLGRPGLRTSIAFDFRPPAIQNVASVKA